MTLGGPRLRWVHGNTDGRGMPDDDVGHGCHHAWPAPRGIEGLGYAFSFAVSPPLVELWPLISGPWLQRTPVAGGLGIWEEGKQTRNPKNDALADSGRSHTCFMDVGAAGCYATLVPYDY